MRPLVFRILTRGICLFLLTLSACNNQSTPKPPRIPTPLDLSIVGTVSGQVRFEGTVPDQATLQLGGWSACAAQYPDGLPQAADLLVHDGKLQNALVYIKTGLGDRVFAVPTEPVTSDQTGCLFSPRIMAVAWTSRFGFSTVTRRPIMCTDCRSRHGRGILAWV